MENNITYNLTQSPDYKFVVSLGGFDNDLICYDFYKKSKLFGLTLYWKKFKVETKTKRTVWDAKDTVNWGKDEYIYHGIGIWADRTTNGREEFIRLTKKQK